MEKKRNKLTNPWVVCILALICTFLWGSAIPSVKTGYQMFSIRGDDTASQILFAGYRFTLAGVLTFAISCIIEKKVRLPKKEIWGNVVILGLIQTTVQYVFFYVGLSNTTGVKGAIITASNSFFSILIAHFMIRERITRRKTIGCILGFAGVIVINLTQGGFAGGLSFTGEGFLILSCFSYGFSAVFVKTFVNKDKAFTITAYQLLLGGVILIAIGMGLGGEVHGFTPKSILLLIYMAIISSVAFSLWALLLQHNSVSRVSIYGFTNPVFGVLLSAVFLGEKALTMQNLAALLLVSLGIIVVNLQLPFKSKMPAKHKEPGKREVSEGI